jgi:tetratricopeptide (TPR) repeat protein
MTRSCAWCIRPFSVVQVALVFALWPVSVASRAASGQEKQTTKPVANAEPLGALAVGSHVVLKSFRIALDDDGKHVPAWGQTYFWIDRMEGERVRVLSQDKSKRGWVPRDQVVPAGQAIDFFTGLITKDPNDFDALLSRSQLWVEWKDDDRALADFEQLIKLSPDYARPYASRGAILLRKGRVEQAAADLNKSIQVEPKDPVAYLERSKVWIAQQDHRRARADLDEAIRLSPTYVAAFWLRSSAWESQGNLDEAVKDLSEAIRLAPTDGRSFLFRGILWDTRKEYDKAIADFSEVIKLDPNYAVPYFLRANAWREKRDRAKEIADYSLAIEHDPKNAEYRKARAIAWSTRGMHDEAIADYDEAIRLAPTDAEAYRSRGGEWLKDAIAGQTAPDKAIADLSRAIELDPKDSMGYLVRSDAWRLKRDYRRLVQDLESVVQLEASSPKRHMALARVLATCKDAPIRDGKRAVQIATVACELSHWADSACLDTLAAAYAETGDFAAAIKWETKAIALYKGGGGASEADMNYQLKLYQDNKPCRE